MTGNNQSLFFSPEEKGRAKGSAGIHLQQILHADGGGRQ